MEATILETALSQAAPSEACRTDNQVLVYPEILLGINAEYHTAGHAVKENLILDGGDGYGCVPALPGRG